MRYLVKKDELLDSIFSHYIAQVSHYRSKMFFGQWRKFTVGRIQKRICAKQCVQQAEQRRFFSQLRKKVEKRKEELEKLEDARRYARAVLAERALRCLHAFGSAGSNRIKRLSLAYCKQRLSLMAFSCLKQYRARAQRARILFQSQCRREKGKFFFLWEQVLFEHRTVGEFRKYICRQLKSRVLKRWNARHRERKEITKKGSRMRSERDAGTKRAVLNAIVETYWVRQETHRFRGLQMRSASLHRAGSLLHAWRAVIERRNVRAILFCEVQKRRASRKKAAFWWALKKQCQFRLLSEVFSSKLATQLAHRSFLHLRQYALQKQEERSSHTAATEVVGRAKMRTFFKRLLKRSKRRSKEAQARHYRQRNLMNTAINSLKQRVRRSVCGKLYFRFLAIQEKGVP